MRRLNTLWLLAPCILIFAICCNAKPLTVNLVTAQSVTIPQTIFAFGNISSQHLTYIQSELPGQVLQLKAYVGDEVKSGQIVAVIDPKPANDQLQAAQAQLAKVSAMEKNQADIVRRAKILVAKQSYPKSSLQIQQTKLTAIQSELRAAQAEVDNAKFQLGKTKVKAAMNGVIQQVKVTVGSIISAGTPIYLLTNTDELQAVLLFSQSERNLLKVGQTVILSSDASGEHKEVTAKISRIKPMINEVNRSVEVLVNFPNPGDWYPGASVKGVVTIRTAQKAVMVPSTAVVRKNNQPVVFTVKNGKAVNHKVKIGRIVNGNIQILSGLQPNSKVVSDGADFLDNETSVIATTGK